MKARFLGELAVIAAVLGFSGNAAWAAGLGPKKASDLVYSTGYSLGNISQPCFGSMQVALNRNPNPGEVLIVTSFSWGITGAPANSIAEVVLRRSDEYGSYSPVDGVHATALANSTGVATGTVNIQPGVVALKGDDTDYPHLCIENLTNGAQSSSGALVGYIAKDK